MHSSPPSPITARHSMPFGAELTSGGQVRFRLWAPSARKVDLLLFDADLPSGADDVTRALAMLELADGWFELVTPEARVGSRYRFRIDDGTEVPDPASRCNPQGVHRNSEVVDPASFDWGENAWRAPPWREAVVYELHIGTFTPEGTFAAVEDKLEHLASLGVTAIELMPIAEFPGARGWGYDGVLLFAPKFEYGTANDLKSLIRAAHRRGIAVLLDVVYNHFGPEGNYLHGYACDFFTERHQTPWGAAINFDGERSRTVRDFFIHNTLYWLDEFRFDGLRYDAVHAICDDSATHILNEIAQTAHSGPRTGRTIYLVLENGSNQAQFLRAATGSGEKFDAQWNDDIHHCLHAIVTGEADGYYEDYAADARRLLGRCLAEGFAYQGEFSSHEGCERGEHSASLPPAAFVAFLQNHDQIGNRAFGERITRLARSADALHAALAIYLLAPSPPMLFMGEEWAAPQPFLYFGDFEPELAGKVREGRRREFAKFKHFSSGESIDRIPDPTAAATRDASRLDWSDLRKAPNAAMLATYRSLLAIRKTSVAPLIEQIVSAQFGTHAVGDADNRGAALGHAEAGAASTTEAQGALWVAWSLRGGARLWLLANLSDEPQLPALQAARQTPRGRLLFATHGETGPLEPWAVRWIVENADDR